MTDEQWEHAVTLFHAWIERPPETRSTFWDDHPGVPADVRAEVLTLVAAHEEASGYLTGSALGEVRPAAGTRIGPWRLGDVIGQGGMSLVYRAERVEGGFGQQAAVKLIALPALVTRGTAEVIHRRFEAERQIVARLDHPDICRLLEGGVTGDGVPYLVLEYVDGVDLVTHLLPHDDATRLELLARVARTVHHAHQRLVVHRDLKPSNVLVTKDGHPKLLDFGIAKALDPASWQVSADLTSTVHRAATPAYASPEQLTGAVVTTATDVYSLGRLVRAVFTDRTTRDVDAIVARATRETPADRYASAADLAADLDRCRLGRPVEARQGNVRYVVGKFVRRHAAAVALAALALLLVAAFAIVTRIQMREAQRERARATQVADFLRGLFEASDPEVNRGNRLTTRQLLDDGAERIRHTALDEDTRDALLETMADAYAGLGVHDSANALYESLLPRAASDAERATLLRRIAVGTSQLGRHDDADAWATRAVAAAERAARLDVLALALNSRCLALSNAAKVAEATPVCAQAATQAQSSTLPVTEQVRLLRDHGNALKAASAFAESERVLQEALRRSRDGATTPQPATATTHNALGSLYFRQGRFDEAATAYTQAIEAQRQLYPDGHADLARSLNNLANLHSTMRRADQAIVLYTEAHALYRRYLGDDHGELATSMSNLAVTHQLTGQLDEAAATLDRVSTIHARTTGATRLPYWSTRLKLVSVRLEQNRGAEAADVAREVIAGLEALTPKPAIERGLARVMLATGLIESGRSAEALVPAREGHALLAAAVAPTHWMRAYADMALGGALAATGQRAEGRRLLAPHVEALPPTSPSGESWRAGWLRRLWARYGANG